MIKSYKRDVLLRIAWILSRKSIFLYIKLFLSPTSSPFPIVVPCHFRLYKSRPILCFILFIEMTIVMRLDKPNGIYMLLRLTSLYYKWTYVVVIWYELIARDYHAVWLYVLIEWSYEREVLLMFLIILVNILTYLIYDDVCALWWESRFI